MNIFSIYLIIILCTTYISGMEHTYFFNAKDLFLKVHNPKTNHIPIKTVIHPQKINLEKKFKCKNKKHSFWKHFLNTAQSVLSYNKTIHLNKKGQIKLPKITKSDYTKDIICFNR